MTQDADSNVEQNQNLYFAYGSNLSLEQMRNRCPGSTYFGFGVLKGYKWIINARGYANVVRDPSHAVIVDEDSARQSEGTAASAGVGVGDDEGNEVQGMLYRLTREDERRLDKAEGVPFIYEKHVLGIELLSSSTFDHVTSSSVVDALVYVDVQRVEGGNIREEYIGRMNRGIRDAMGKGMSDGYINSVLRKWIPAENEVDGASAEVGDPFLWQARGEQTDSEN